MTIFPYLLVCKPLAVENIVINAVAIANTSTGVC